MIELGEFSYSLLGNALEKHTQTNEGQGKKQVEALKVSKPDTQQLSIKDEIREDKLSKEAKNKIKKLKKQKKWETEKQLFYRSDKYTYNFQQYETIRSLQEIFILVKLLVPDEDQINLLTEITHFKKKTIPRNQEKE